MPIINKRFLNILINWFLVLTIPFWIWPALIISAARGEKEILDVLNGKNPIL